MRPRWGRPGQRRLLQSRSHRVHLAACLASALLLLLSAPLRLPAQNAPPPFPFSVPDPGQAALGNPVPGATGAGETAAPATPPGASTPGSSAPALGGSQRIGEGGGTQRTPAPIAPAPLTEFQRLVFETTGQQLGNFGAGLFGPVPSTFAPVQNIPVSPTYVLGPGDQIRLQVWGQVNQAETVTVDRTGDIALPDLGAVHVAGLRYDQLTEFLRGQLARVYRNFDLNVNLGQLRSIQIFVVGQARRPGSYTVSSLSTLLNALFASGGPLPQGSLRHILLKRGSQTVVDFDLYDLLLHGDKSRDAVLEPGDVILIPPVGPQVAVLGSVLNPAIYELKGAPGGEQGGGTTVEQLIQLAGGRSSTAAGESVQLERIEGHEQRSIVDVDLATAPGTALRNGDIVTVRSIVDRFSDAVTLRGNVANPGRYPWHEGMRVRDLIPTRESLLTRNYWRKRNQLGQPATEDQPQAANPREGALDIHGNAGAPAGGTAANQPQSSTAAGTQAGSAAGGTSVGVALTGGSNVFTPTTDVVLSAPDIDWSYAVVERQDKRTLKTVLLPFNLGRLVLDGDASQNLLLEPNDVVTIFSTSDIKVASRQQTRFVRLEGEFNSAGVYSVLPGETLRHLVERAGGLSPDAYLYASEFTRDSTRRVQSQRLREYADQLEAQVIATTSSASARAISDRDAAAAQVAATTARAAIDRLRQLQPAGRIVLQLRPDDHTPDALPELALEDGDRFVVPRVPSSVSVEGQVYSANAFVFERDRRTRFYLREAGGPDRLADTRRAFILRADGSVFNRQYGNFERAHIFPGDTIVMPPRLTSHAILRNLVDISSIIGQFGIGVAAINVLK